MPAKGYIDLMSQKPNISHVADAFFHLWQKQVSLLAQSPDEGFGHLLVEGQKLAGQLKTVDLETDDDDIDTPSNP